MEAAGRRYVVHPSRSDVFSLWGLGDIHLGNPGCDLKHCKRDIAKIEADPFALWIGLGDYGDFIAPGDKRFQADSLDDGAKLNIGRLGAYYMEQARDLFWPIKDKCLGLLKGNHEEAYFSRNNQENAHGWLCVEMGVPNLQYCSLFDLSFYTPGRVKKPAIVEKPPIKGTGFQHSFRIYCHHGSGSSSSPGGKLNTLIKHMQNCDADLYFMGHVHDQKGQRMVTLGANADCTKITQKIKLGVISGSFLQTYAQSKTTYGEIKGYAPTVLGAARISINPETRDVRGEV